MLDRLFLKFSEEKLRQLESRIGMCLDKLSFEEIWRRGGEEQNSVGNLVLHLSGNVRQWLLTGVGGESDTRNREAEFAARESAHAGELKSTLNDTMSGAFALLSSLPAERLEQRLSIQGYEVSVLEGIYHVVEHFAMHTGQIIYITKMVKQEDLAFYGHIKSVQHGERTP